MIRYSLICKCGHEFDAWFQSIAAYDHQAEAGDVACPACGSTSVEKAIMAPRIANLARPSEGPSKEAVGNPVAVSLPHQTGTGMEGPMAERRREFLHEMRTLRDKITAQSENVGPKFAEEARRMHFDEAPSRSIHGVATLREVDELIDDGIDVLPLPTLPEDLS